MTRKIKFRGLRTDGKGWVYGDLLHAEINFRKCVQIVHWSDDENISEVIPETIGQFTGLKDKNGKEIYENDIIDIISSGFDFECQVTYDKELIPVGEKSKGWEHMLYSPYWEQCEVIGNIYANNKS